MKMGSQYAVVAGSLLKCRQLACGEEDIFQNGLKPISIDNIRNASGEYQYLLALACG